jgi:hypothetical protein
MCHVIHIIYDHVVAEIRTDDGAVIEPYGQAQVLELKEERFQFTDPDKPEKCAILDEVWIKGIRNQYIIPVIRTVVVTNQHLYFRRSQFTIADTIPVLPVAQMVFISALG